MTAPEIITIIVAATGAFGGLAAAIVTVITATSASKERQTVAVKMEHTATGVSSMKDQVDNVIVPQLKGIEIQTNSRLSEALQQIAQQRVLLEKILNSSQEDGKAAFAANLQKDLEATAQRATDSREAAKSKLL